MSLARQIFIDTPAAYWPLDETSGTTATDRSGNSRDSTWGSAPTPAALGPFAHAQSLGGTQETSVAGASWQRPTSGTVELWLSTTGAAALTALIDNRAGSEGGAPTVYMNSSGFIQAGNGKAAGNSYASTTQTTGAVVNDGKLHFITYVWEFSTDTIATIYVDGVVVKTATIITAASVNPVDDTFRIAGENGSRRVTGSLANVALYPSALSVDRINAHYQAGLRNGASV